MTAEKDRVESVVQALEARHAQYGSSAIEMQAASLLRDQQAEIERLRGGHSGDLQLLTETIENLKGQMATLRTRAEQADAALTFIADHPHGDNIKAAMLGQIAAKALGRQTVSQAAFDAVEQDWKASAEQAEAEVERLSALWNDASDWRKEWEEARAQIAAMQAAIEQAAEEMEINGLDLDTLAPFIKGDADV